MLYAYHRGRFQRIIETIQEASRLLESNGIKYAVIKTLRPYPEDTADIDILIFGDDFEYYEGIKVLSSVFKPIDAVLKKAELGLYDYRSFKILPYAGYPYRDKIKLDIHKELAVLNMVYVDKNKLRMHVRRIKLLSGGETRVLTPSMEILINVAHSVIKENSFSLADYLTTLYYLAELRESEIDALTSLVIEDRLKTTFRWYMGIASTLHLMAHGFIPKSLWKILSRIGGSLLALRDVATLIQQEPPYKPGLTVLTRIYCEKLRHNIFRKNLLIAMLKVIKESKSAETVFRRLLSLNRAS
jgi:hypothetical protein